MRKKITLFLLLFTLSTISLNAQVGVALYLEKASICKQNNGKFSLNDSHKKPIIADADTIFTISDVFYYICLLYTSDAADEL